MGRSCMVKRGLACSQKTVTCERGLVRMHVRGVGVREPQCRGSPGDAN